MDAKRLEDALHWHWEQAVKILEKFDSRQSDEPVGVFRYSELSDNETQLFVYMIPPGGSPREHVQDYFELLFPYRGACTVRMEGREIRLADHDFYLISPGLIHAVEVAHEQGCAFCVAGKIPALYSALAPILTGNEPFLRYLMSCISSPNVEDVMLLKGSLFPCARNLVEMLIVESAEKAYLYERFTESAVSLLLTMFARQLYEFFPSEREGIRGRTGDIIKYMKEHAASTTLAETARRFGYHPDYLSAALRRETGKNFVELLRGYRMEQAECLLRTTDLPAARIAAAVGYGQYSGFFKVFRQQYGVSPGEYRSQMRERE